MFPIQEIEQTEPVDKFFIFPLSPSTMMLLMIHQQLVDHILSTSLLIFIFFTDQMFLFFYFYTFLSNIFFPLQQVKSKVTYPQSSSQNSIQIVIPLITVQYVWGSFISRVNHYLSTAVWLPLFISLADCSAFPI